jgi:hypothetical protein
MSNHGFPDDAAFWFVLQLVLPKNALPNVSLLAPGKLEKGLTFAVV